MTHLHFIFSIHSKQKNLIRKKKTISLHKKHQIPSNESLKRGTKSLPTKYKFINRNERLNKAPICMFFIRYFNFINISDFSKWINRVKNPNQI